MSAEQLEVLRKRAERFGTISPAIESIEIADKKKQRLDRFITSAATADATPAATPVATPVVEATPLTGPAAVVTGDIKTMSAEERKKLRAERFK
jgi:BRCT domain type II-containing protein